MKHSVQSASIRRLQTFLSALLLFAGSSSLCHAATTNRITVGNPTEPTALQGAIVDAYAGGRKRITIAPGVYVLPPNPEGAGIVLRNMKDVEIDAYGVQLSLQSSDQGALYFSKCHNVTFKGATLHYTAPNTGQAKILAVGEDKNGVYYDVQLAPGYPADAQFHGSVVMDGRELRLKPGTGGLEARSILPLDAPGKKRIYWSNVPTDNVWGIVPGDQLACRGPGGMMVHVEACDHCTFQDLTIYWGGIFGFWESDDSSGNRYLHDEVTYGPIPPGGVSKPLVSQSADGFHSGNSAIGPDIENCMFEGMLDDGIAIHGSFYQVALASGNTVVIGSRWAIEFQPGDPIRIYDGATGSIVAGTITSVQPSRFTTTLASRYPAFRTNLHYFDVTVDRSVSMPFDAIASAPARCGCGYKIIGCTIRNNASRGMLLKADNGLIKHNLIDGSAAGGIVVAPEINWGEADYSRNVTIVENTIRHTTYLGLDTWSPQAAALTITGEGCLGNQNIVVRSNTFEGINVANIEVRWARDVVIEGNRFLNAHEEPSPIGDAGKDCGIDAHSVIWLGDCDGVTIQNNTAKNSGHVGSYLISTSPSAIHVTGIGNGGL